MLTDRTKKSFRRRWPGRAVSGANKSAGRVLFAFGLLGGWMVGQVKRIA